VTCCRAQLSLWSSCCRLERQPNVTSKRRMAKVEAIDAQCPPEPEVLQIERPVRGAHPPSATRRPPSIIWM